MRVNNGEENKKLIDNVIEMIEEKIVRHPNISLTKIKHQTEEEQEVEPSTTTINIALQQIGFKKNKPLEASYGNENIFAQRMKQVNFHKNDKFTNVVFADESAFQLFENRQWVWYRNSEHPQVQQSLSKEKIIIWAGISRKKKQDLSFLRQYLLENVNIESYRECLEESLIPTMNESYRFGRWRYQQDNARPHKADVIKQLLEENQIKSVDLPPYSPDLNPKEKVWGWLKDKVMTRTFTTIDELMEEIELQWEELNLDIINSQIDNQFKQIEKVKQSNGQFV